MNLIARLVYGGSFNPIHKGHLDVIDYVLKKNICLEIFIIPNYQSPFKDLKDYAPPEIRLEMIHYAIQSYFSLEIQNKIKILDIEIREKKISYTVETLKKIRDNVKTGILIGSDHLEHLLLWKEIEWIFTYYPFYVIKRKNAEESVKQKIEKIQSFYPSCKFVLIDYVPKNCESKLIREKIKWNADYSDLSDCLTPEVFSLIKKNKLYS
ncbi:MAG: nicotinate-nicotinamide nucleotide adenylyltransferase [Leptonema sp. (in: bacteria)]